MVASTDDGDLQAFLHLLQTNAPLGARAAAAIAERMHRRAFDKGQALLRGGDLARWCFFICHGLVREYYIDDAGKEFTRTFLPEGELTGSLLDLLSGAPAVTWIEALEPTDTLCLAWRDLDALCERFPEIHVVLRRLAERVYVRKVRREHEFLTLSAAQRHDVWLARHKDLDRRLSRYLVASYLGITPEHLSRLRRGS
jgi:CRP-like cAMP-binding protein